MAKHSTSDKTSDKDTTGHRPRGRARAARTADQPVAEAEARPPVWQAAFLEALAQNGVVRYAAEAAGVARSQVYARREADQQFASAWASAIDSAADRLELEAWRRAVEGTERPVYGSGGRGAGTVEVGRVREYSDRLLEFLLRGVRPDKYRERHDHRHSGSLDDQRRAVQRDADALAKLPYAELVKLYEEALADTAR